MSSHHMQRSNNPSQSSQSISAYTGFENDNLTDTELVKLVNELKDEIRILKLENEILENTIMRVDPALMHGVYHALEYVTKMHSSSSLNIHISSFTKTPTSKFGLLDSLFCSSRMIGSPSKISTRKSSSRISGTVIYGSGPRVNILELLELISIEHKIKAVNLESVKNKAAKRLAYLKAQLEEIEIQVSNTENETMKFNQDVLIDGWDKIAQRIPAEIWIRFMTDWMKRTDKQVGKLRLRVSTFNAQYRKFKGQMKAKADLSENLRPVDFDKIKIDNSECEKLIEYKIEQIGMLKTLTGNANLNLVVHKKALMDQNTYLTKVLMTKNNREQQIVQLNKESELIQVQVDILSQKLEEVKKIRMAHEVPDVMDYVEVKWVLTGLNHAIKMLENRVQIHHSALTMTNKKLKTLLSEKDASTTSTLS